MSLYELIVKDFPKGKLFILNLACRRYYRQAKWKAGSFHLTFTILPARIAFLVGSARSSGAKYDKSKNGGRKTMKCRLTTFGCLSFIICLLNVQTYGVDTSK